MAINLGAAFIDVSPSTGKLADEVRSKIDPIFEQAGKRAGSSVSGGFGSTLISSLTGFGDRVTNVIGTWFKRGALIGSAAAAGLFGATLWAGFGRLTAIDDAEAKLRGLGHSAESVQVIMDSALTSVKGTAFGLGEAATIAASAVAAGIEPGKELTRTLSLTGDAAAIAGISLGEMGSIFNKIAANQKLTTMELNQLQDRGIPVLQWLQEEYGVTADKARDMVTRGQVDFETFQNLIEKNIGGAALAMGDSFSGAFANMRAAFSRLGAEILRPFFGEAKDVFGSVTVFVDRLTERVKPFQDTMTRALGNVRGAFELFMLSFRTGVAFATNSGFETWFSKFGVTVKAVFDWVSANRDSIESFFEAFVPAAGAVTGLAVSFSLVSKAFALLQAATPVGLILAVATALVYAWQNSETFREVVTNVFNTLLTVVGPVIELLRSMLSSLFGGDGEGSWGEVAGAAWAKVQEVVGAVVAWFGEHVVPTLQSFFDAIVAIFTVAVALVTEIWNMWGDRIMQVLGIVVDYVKNALEAGLKIVRGIFEVFAGLFSGDWSRMWEGIKTIISGAWDLIKNYLSTAWELLKVLLSTVWESIKTTASNAWNTLKDAIVGAMNAAWSRVKEVAAWIKDKIDSLVEPFRRLKEMAQSVIPGTYNNADGSVTTTSFGFGIKLPWVGHDGGIVPGGPSDEHLAVLQGGEIVLSHGHIAALKAGAPAGSGGPLMQFGDVNLHDELDVTTFARLLNYELAGAVG